MAITNAWTALADWQHWAIISTFFSAAAFLLLLYIQFGRPWIRRIRLKWPFRAYFLITSRQQCPLDYVQQDHREHYVKELVVPANSEIPIQIVLHPRLSFLQRELYFGCGETLTNPEKPSATEWFVSFVVKGVRREGKPDASHPGHYIDYNGFYHVREDFLYTNDVRVIGFKLVTKAVGVYRAQIYAVTDDVRGKAELVLRVEQPATTKMRCVIKRHWARRCIVAPTRT
jgi:hypothetical protein